MPNRVEVGIGKRILLEKVSYIKNSSLVKTFRELDKEAPTSF